MTNDDFGDEVAWRDADAGTRSRRLLHTIVRIKRTIAIDRERGGAATTHPASNFAGLAAKAAQLDGEDRSTVDDALRDLVAYAADALAQLRWSPAERAVLDDL